MKQIKNVIKAEGHFDRDRCTLNFKNLSKKVQMAPEASAPAEKQEMHLMRKKHFAGLRGPGTYPIEAKATAFNKKPRAEQHQCFNSTANRFPPPLNTGVRSTQLGPGTYDVIQDVFSRSISSNRANTAAFLSRRPEDIFGIKDLPGPQEYETNASTTISRGKSWTTTVQAFGSTEKRFVAQSMSVPGPGQYKSERHVRAAQNYAMHRVRGQLVKVRKTNKESASFKSKTGRLIENETNHASKLAYPGVQAYQANEWDTIG